MCSFQIYNEMIRDLLNPSLGFLELREDAKGNVQVAGISEVTTRSTDEVNKQMNMAVFKVPTVVPMGTYFYCDLSLSVHQKLCLMNSQCSCLRACLLSYWNIPDVLEIMILL